MSDRAQGLIAVALVLFILAVLLLTVRLMWASHAFTVYQNA